MEVENRKSIRCFEKQIWRDKKGLISMATDIYIIAMAYNILRNQEITLAKEGVYEIKLSKKHESIKRRKES